MTFQVPCSCFRIGSLFCAVCSQTGFGRFWPLQTFQATSPATASALGLPLWWHAMEFLITIQALGRWSSSTFQLYIRTLSEALEALSTKLAYGSYLRQQCRSLVLALWVCGIASSLQPFPLSLRPVPAFWLQPSLYPSTSHKGCFQFCWLWTTRSSGYRQAFCPAWHACFPTR